MPQLFQTSFDYTALDLVLMGRAQSVGLFAQPSSTDERVAREALDRLGIANLSEMPLHALSGGQRQLVSIARALASEADILVLDEPASSLDMKNQLLILDTLASLCSSDAMTIVFTSHHPQHATAIANKVLLMMSDQHYRYGPPEEVMTEQTLTELYEVPMKRITFQHLGKTSTTFAAVSNR